MKTPQLINLQHPPTVNQRESFHTSQSRTLNGQRDKSRRRDSDTMSYANYDDDCFDDFDEDDDDWQVGDDTPCQKGNTVTAAPSGSSKLCDDVPHTDLPTGEQAFTHRTVPGDTRGRAQDSGGFPQQVATNTHESASNVLGSTRTQPAMTQTKGTGTSTGTVRQPTSVCRRVEEHGVVADTNGVSEVVRNNPNVSPAWIKQMLTNEQEGSKAPVGSKQVLSSLSGSHISR